MSTWRTLSAFMRVTYIFSTVPPRLKALFKRNTVDVPCAFRSLQRIFRMLPDVSLPQVTNPAPLRAVQLRITTFSVGRFTRSPSASLPDLIQMLSSLQSMIQSSIRIFVDESISIPSVLGPCPPILLSTVIPLTVQWSE